MPFTIAIDGPAGAGKSTVARRVAAMLGYTYIDTGAMYRAVAWKATAQQADTTNEAVLAQIAQALKIDFSPLTPDGTQQVFADGEDVTSVIRSPEISSLTSAVSALPAVRRVIVEQQRALGRSDARGVVLEGRDIGSVVFPHAELKIFLTASPEVRARRRCEELKARGLDVDYVRILEDQRERDARDSQRHDSPLIAAPDAVLLDTDTLPIGEVVARILALWHERQAENHPSLSTESPNV